MVLLTMVMVMVMMVVVIVMVVVMVIWWGWIEGHVRTTSFKYSDNGGFIFEIYAFRIIDEDQDNKDKEL
ncbi:hypothetical protein HZH66_012893 [Vespula vulgaris]|uniref:Transmembrane protein n=1 Tax=Vespula vulgaris TaxID=7454 RepID=A0A834J8A6_VESVU|nr:hypothetical protein HZH66_012893 [Vespula vulgaris]